MIYYGTNKQFIKWMDVLRTKESYEVGNHSLEHEENICVFDKLVILFCKISFILIEVRLYLV